jgi:hypothetical protein
MLTTWQKLINGQYEAALCMLNRCIDQCPESDWDAPVVNLKFCQVAFHVLFFTDFYLESTEDAIRDQAFHRANLDAFRDYEELEDRKQQLLYERAFLKDYVQHCRTKSGRVVASESEQSLTTRCGFSRRDCSRAELHVLNIRHIQHHTAQLSLKLKLDANKGAEWVGSGWNDE